MLRESDLGGVGMTELGKYEYFLIYKRSCSLDERAITGNLNERKIKQES